LSGAVVNGLLKFRLLCGFHGKGSVFDGLNIRLV